MSEINTRNLLSEAKFYESYSRWDDSKQRYETWDEAVDRVMNMHREYYKDKMTPELSNLIDFATQSYKEKKILGAQRALQFGGEQLLKNHARMYNCVSSYADRPAFFGEYFWFLLSGAGAGFSIQTHHVAKLPKIQERKKTAKSYVVEDSIEGWADALAVLMSSFFVGGGTKPEYEGRRVYFDLTNIRPKGAFISGGFKAPGPEPLRKCLDKIEYLLQGKVLKGNFVLKPIEVYDICMHAADAVLAGGVRRAATIALFSADDEEMVNAKTGNWFIDNPQRARSNNSAMIKRDEITREKFAEIFKRVKEFGEPGFIFTDSYEFTFNPCVEICKFPIDIDTGKSGWQACNLCEINGAAITSFDALINAVKAATIIGTLQAGYTHFPYLDEVSKRIVDREALLGVSITGWMNNPEILFNPDNLKEAATFARQVNKEVAQLIGINPAARITTSKPSGNASVLLGTASGIHPEHSSRYIRHVQMNKEMEVAQLVKKTNPYMVEDSIWSSNNTDYMLAFPVISPETSIFKENMLGVELLEKVKLAQQTWIEYGTNVELCTDPRLRHNISNTITVPNDKWDEVEEYVFNNRQHFAGISFLSSSGDRDYYQAPFTAVKTPSEIIAEYGSAGIFASGLVTDALKVFSNLWRAIDVAKDSSISTNQDRLDTQSDWIRRFNKFADNYFNGDIQKAGYCLKDVAILHKWEKIQQNYSEVDFVSQLLAKKYTEMDTMGATACSGPNGCEIF